MDDLTRIQVTNVLSAVLQNLAVVSDQLESLKGIKGLDVSAPIKELGETKESIALTLTDLRSV